MFENLLNFNRAGMGPQSPLRDKSPVSAQECPIKAQEVFYYLLRKRLANEPVSNGELPAELVSLDATATQEGGDSNV